MSRPLVIFHSPCIDGWCAAWVMDRCLNGVELYPANHGDAPPRVDGRTVIVVDFSYPREIMEIMNEDAHRLIVLDHHKTAHEDCRGLDYCIFNMDKSGAVLALDWCKHYGHYTNYAGVGRTNRRDIAKGMESLTQYVQDRDLWKWELPHSRAINTAIASYRYDLNTWDELARRMGIVPEALMTEGEAIERYREIQIQHHIKHAMPVLIDGIEVMGVECTTLNYISDIGERLAKDMPFACTWNHCSDGQLRVSLRSTDPDGMDVSEIAKRFGGGGHKHSSAFRVPIGTIVGINSHLGVLHA